MAARQPEVAALKVPQGRAPTGEIAYLSLTFRELDAEVGAWAAHLRAKGVRSGDRVLVMVRQGLPLIAAAFALFRLGAVPVIIDPGMGLKPFLACVRHARPRVLLGIPLAQIVSHVARGAFASVEVRVWASGSMTGRRTRPAGVSEPAAFVASGETTAAILFTSGSTGAPKGVVYTHGMFDAQVGLIRDTYNIQPGEVDLPMLPIFALFNPALGMTTIVPEIDPSKPGAVDPEKIVQAIQQEGVTNSFGSPTLWRKIQAFCAERSITLPTMKRVLCAGAPVPAALWQGAAALLPNGRLHSPYGATEVLPVSSVASDEIDATSVRGACVGRIVEPNTVKIIALADGPLASLVEARELPAGEIGEIVVTGPTVTTSYDRLPEATRAAKLRDASGRIWHRMGDCGFLDDEGRLWFCGRKVERVVLTDATLFTEPCEQVFRGHPRAARCALIAVGDADAPRAAIVVETAVADSAEGRRLARELRELAKAHAHTERIKIFYFNPTFPVDVRHNAKIHRLTLARWAATAKGYESDPKR